MPDNKELNPQNSPAPAGAQTPGNGQRHGRHGHRGHGNRGAHSGQRPEGQAPQEKAAQAPQTSSAPAESRPPRGNQNNRPRNAQNGGKQKTSSTPQNGGKPQNSPNAGNPNAGKQNAGKQNGKPKQNPAAPAENRPKQNGENPAVQQESGKRPRQDRNNRRRDRKNGDRRKEAAQQETALPDSLITESFLPPKDSGFFSLKKAEDDADLDSMPPDPTLDAVFAAPVPVQEPTEGTEIVGIHFPQGGKVYYFDPIGISFTKGSYAIVETARGLELGEVALSNRKVPESSIVQPLKPVIRLATEEDLEHVKKNTAKEADALAICKKKVEDHKLDMKLTGAQYTFDNAKLIFYFTAAQRVDFRELVKDLATTFHTRIELRQIGSRDEAKMVGGFGLCGRHLCCASFLPNYCQSTIKMAKRQGLGLNAGKSYGMCGRLMCCLKFEESTYERELAVMPTVGSMVETPDGRGAVTDVRPVGYFVRVKLDEKPDAAPKLFKLADIRVLQRADEVKDEEPETPEEES